MIPDTMIYIPSSGEVKKYVFLFFIVQHIFDHMTWTKKMSFFFVIWKTILWQKNKPSLLQFWQVDIELECFIYA